MVDTGATGKFTRTNALQTYISLMAYTFDILSFVAITFVTVPFGKAIYPNSNFANSLLIVWGGFAAGSVLRPLGAAWVGPLYDRVGRKRGLYIGILGSSLFTAAIAAIPTYATAGIVSPILYIVLRLVGGIFIGALIAGGLVFTTENLPERLRGFITGTAEAGGSWAHVLGAAWLLLIGAVLVGGVNNWFGWRMMFLVTLLPLILILPVLYKVKESEIFVRATSRRKTSKHVYAKLFEKGSAMRTSFFIAVISSIGLLGYDNLTENQFPTFLKVVNHVGPTLAMIVLIGALFGVVGSMLGGAISQKTGRKPFAIASGVLLMAISFLFLYLGTLKANEFYTIIGTLIPFYFFASIAKANLSLFLNESFTTEVRSTAVGLNWNLGYGIAGIWPLIITYLYKIYGTSMYSTLQTVFLFILGALYLVAFLKSKETLGNISKEEKTLETVSDAGGEPGKAV